MRSDLTRRLPRRFDAPALGASHSARPLHILWIDDDPAGAGSADGLSTHGVTVDLASTGQAGIRLACGAGHDVILLSLELPDQPGTGVLAELRRLGVLSPVIALASRPDVRTAFSAGRFGAAEYRSKPLSAEELFVAIREVAVRSLPASSEGPDLSRTLPVASASAVGVTRALDALDCGLPSFGPTSESAASRLNALGRALARMASDPTLPIGFFQASCRAIRLVASEKSWAVEATVSQVRRWLSAASERESVGRHPSVRSLLEGMRLASAKPADWRRAAAAWGLESRTVTRHVQAETGWTVRQWVQAARMREAARALASTGDQVAQIAYALGYDHPTQFDRDFRRALGVAPKEFRRLLDGVWPQAADDPSRPVRNAG